MRVFIRRYLFGVPYTTLSLEFSFFRLATTIIPTPIMFDAILNFAKPNLGKQICVRMYECEYTIPSQPLRTAPLWRSEMFYLRLLVFFCLRLLLFYFFYAASCHIMRDAIDVRCNEQNRHLLFISSISMEIHMIYRKFTYCSLRCESEWVRFFHTEQSHVNTANSFASEEIRRKKTKYHDERQRANVLGQEKWWRRTTHTKRNTTKKEKRKSKSEIK